MHLPAANAGTARRLLSTASLVLGCAASAPALASCGADFCVLDSAWSVQGMNDQAGRLRLDLRYEYVRQDRLTSGSHRISADEAVALNEEALEGKTLNRNLVGTLDYAIDGHWGVSATLPWVSRSHDHVLDPTGADGVGPVTESWTFQRMGDLRVVGRYSFAPGASGTTGVQFGLKLPTGDDDLRNGDGTVAERSLQPGSGSTDLILGAYWSSAPAPGASAWFLQAQAQHATATRDGYRPGDRYTASAGLTYPWSGKLALMGQVNAAVKRRDTGVNAEPDLTGSSQVFLSPGVSYAITPASRLYAFVQLPLYQHARGVQLMPDTSLVLGLSMGF